MTRMDFTPLFYTKQYTGESLVQGLDSLLRTQVLTLTVLPYASEKSPPECFRGHGATREFQLISGQDGVYLFKLTFNSPRPNVETPRIDGMFFVYKHLKLSDTFILFALEPQDFIQRALLPFIAYSRPRIYLSLISHDYLNMLLNDFKTKSNFTDLRVTRASHRSRFMGQAKRETIIPSVSWPNLGLEGAFRFVGEQNAWFKSVTFEALRNRNIQAEVTVARDGQIRTNGAVINVFNHLIIPICNKLQENYELFRKRSRRDSVSLEVSPLTINFGADILQEAEKTKLIEVMRSLDKASVSVVHDNPYLQLSVIDYFDGSTFDLWVLDPRELIIVPQLKGTVSAIRRLVGYVFDNYAEGRIENFRVIR